MWIKHGKKSISKRAIIGFDHGLLCRMKNMALGPQLRQKPRPSASVFVYWVPRAMFFTWHGRPWSNPTSYATSSFVHHFVAIGEFKLELQSGNAQFGSNSTIFRVVWLCNLMYDLWKTIGHLFYATSSCVHHCVAICEFKKELQSGNGQFGSNSTIVRAMWPWNLKDDLEKQHGTSPK